MDSRSGYQASLYRDSLADLVVERDHYVAAPDVGTARTLFARAVNSLNIETSAYCNRTCSFCPVSVVDRRSAAARADLMPLSLFTAIVSDLASIDYRGRLVLSRFNEPTADPWLLDRVRLCRVRLPGARIIVFSNGDALTREYVERLVSAGCDMLRVSFYLSEQPDYAVDVARFDVDVKVQMTRRLERLGLPFTFHRIVPGSCEATIAVPGCMQLFVVGRNFHDPTYRVDRGGTIDSVNPPAVRARTSPCMSPFHSMDIEHDGTVMPCCNLMSDHPAHARLTLGRVTETPGSLFDVFTSREAVAWRRSLMSFEAKASPCAGCAYEVVEDTAANRTRVDRWRRLDPAQVPLTVGRTSTEARESTPAR